MTPKLELPILDEAGNLQIAAPLITQGIMFFPDDGDRQDTFVAALGAASLRQYIADDPDAREAVYTSGITNEPSFWSLLGHEKQYERILTDAEKSASQARLAAEVLIVALSLGAHMPRLASVNNAVKLVGLEQHSNRTTILNSWMRFKPVAHLWAAAFELQILTRDEREDLAAKLLNTVPMEVQNKIPIDDACRLVDEAIDDWVSLSIWLKEGFPQFLRAAEAFRLKAERQQAVGAREPLLPPGVAFAVPTALGLAPCNLEFSPLDDRMVKELGAI